MLSATGAQIDLVILPQVEFLLAVKHHVSPFSVDEIEDAIHFEFGHSP